MVPQIDVFNENGEKIGMTFTKRATQLVNKQKAQWLDELHTKIVLMSTQINKNSKDGLYDYDDENLLKLAVQKIMKQNKLICYLVIYIISLILLCLCNESRLYNYNTEYTLPIFILFTTIFISNVIYLFNPLKYLSQFNEYRINLEYKKLKKLNSNK